MNLDLKGKFKFWRDILRISIYSIFAATIIGLISGIFSYFLTYADELFFKNNWLIFVFPITGIAIVWIYRSLKVNLQYDLNHLIDQLIKKENTDVLQAPAIFSASILTRLTGGPIGACGPSLIIGSSISSFLANKLKFFTGYNDEYIRYYAAIGMSAAIAPIFSSPIFSCVFPLEICHGGLIRPKNLFPCLLASLVSLKVNTLFFKPFKLIETIPFEFGLNILPSIILLAMASSLCFLFYNSAKKLLILSFSRINKFPYIKSFVGGLIVAIFLYFSDRQLLSGSGLNQLNNMLSSQNFSLPHDAFFDKLLLLAIIVSFSFKGGEISPLLFAGGSLGMLLAPILGLDMKLAIILGAIGLFSAYSRCPISAFFLAFELFGPSPSIAYMILISCIMLFSRNSSSFSAQFKLS